MLTPAKEKGEADIKTKSLHFDLLCMVSRASLVAGSPSMLCGLLLFLSFFVGVPGTGKRRRLEKSKKWSEEE